MYLAVRVSFIFLLVFGLSKNCNLHNTESDNVNNANNVHFYEKVNNVNINTKWSNYTYYTFTDLNESISTELTDKAVEVDCFGLGLKFAKILASFFKQNEKQISPLFTTFYMRTRRKSQRDKVMIGDQFGLEWTDFDIRRKSVVIVHGFLSNGDEDWVINMEKAFLFKEDVNVIVTDWSSGSNTWNYYKAAVNTRNVGFFIAQLFDHIANWTIDSQGPSKDEWGGIHFVGHSLGAHISSFAANLMEKSPRKWKIHRITGLDPAQPCFKNLNTDLYLDKTDAEFVDVIHTNGRFLSSLGLGIPQPIGHVDFYPNGGKVQPGCEATKLHKIPLPQSVINQAICSHGKSHSYFTESIISLANDNCTFWAHHWDLSYRQAIKIIDENCNVDNCSQMGINSINYPQRGTFFSLASATKPHCNIQAADKDEILKLLYDDLKSEALD